MIFLWTPQRIRIAAYFLAATDRYVLWGYGPTGRGRVRPDFAASSRTGHAAFSRTTQLRTQGSPGQRKPFSACSYRVSGPGRRPPGAALVVDLGIVRCG